jgi:hypothetical protein
VVSEQVHRLPAPRLSNVCPGRLEFDAFREGGSGANIEDRNVAGVDHLFGRELQSDTVLLFGLDIHLLTGCDEAEQHAPVSAVRLKLISGAPISTGTI